MNYKFRPHGEYEIVVDGSHLLVDAAGPFNEELIKEYRQSLAKAIQQVSGKKWGQIIVLHDMSLFTRDAQEELLNTLRERKKLGLAASAVVLIDVEGASIAKSQLAYCYSNADIEFDFFDSIEQAKSWLSEIV